MGIVGPLLALWQLGSASMLLWGLAAAVPLLIHLWSRRVYRQEPWAAMSFLLAALRKNARQLRLQQWFLLAMRMGILLLFALALANPQFTPLASWGGTAPGERRHVVLVIDGSYSMDYRDGGQSRFDAAKEAAKAFVERSEQTDGFLLVRMSDPPHVLIAEASFNRQALLEEIANLELAHTGAALPATLAEIEALLRRSTGRFAASGGTAKGRVCFFTDLQQATWREVTSSDCRTRLGRLESLASLELIDLGRKEAQNLAVARVAINPAASGLAVVHAPLQIQVEIQSSFTQDRPQQPLELLVDGQRVADELIDVPADGRATLAITHRFDAPGDHLIEVHLTDDALPLDDRRWLAVPVRVAVRVLCIGGRPTETKHVALALAPGNRAGGMIEIAEASENRLLEEDLANFDCVFMCNVGRFSKGEAAVLHRYVSGGGALVVFLGDLIQAASYNQQLANDKATRVLPAQLEEFAPTLTDGYKLDPLEYRHPIVTPFRGFNQSGLLTTPIWKYVKMKPLEGSTTVLAFDNRDPAIVEAPVGSGRSILVATAASQDSLDQTTNPPVPWTALASWPSFPPLVHEMLHFSAATRAGERNLLVGDELTGKFTAPAEVQSALLAGPMGISERLSLTQNGDPGRWSFGTTEVCGAYVVRRGSDMHKYAVNLDPREGDLSRLDPELLPGQLRYESHGLDEQTAVPTSGDLAALFRWLLLAVLLLLMVEPFLAWRFARGFA